nr:uncharacterized protein LOC108943654 [Nicotiana tomentosiformis]
MLIRQRIVQVQQTLLVLYFLLSYSGVQGEKKLSKLEDSELEKQLKLLNKPAVKTIKKKYGDTHDCMNFYKQPAFDHPLLKNHDIHPKIKPTLASTLQNSDMSAVHEANESSGIWLKERCCPFETVPIKRITKDGLIRQRHIPPPEAIAYEAPLSNSNNNSEPKRSSIICDSLFVDPTLYGDNKTRFFVHFQDGNTHCFNTLCPGFAIVSSKYPIDAVFDPVTQRGDKRVLEIAMFIERVW